MYIYTHYNVMIGTSKYKIQSNDSPIRNEWTCKHYVGMSKHTLRQTIHTYINIYEIHIRQYLYKKL